MAEITTRELFDKYYDAFHGDYKAKALSVSIDKPEFFVYEQQVGKEFLDMSVDDLISLLGILGGRYSFRQVMPVMRDLFDYYIDIAQVKIKNPFSDKRMDSHNIAIELAKKNDPIRFSKIEMILDDFRSKDAILADYLELILRLWYDGFFKADEIVDLKESDINPRNLNVSLPGRTVHISNRTYNLLRKFSEMDKMEGWRNYALAPWHGSFFKFRVNINEYEFIDRKSHKEMCGRVYYMISTQLNKKYDTHFNYRNVYWLGFFDYLCRKYGEERTQSMIMSYRNSDDLRLLESAAREYGTYYKDASKIKRYMMELIRF